VKKRKALDTVIKTFLDLGQREYTCSELRECVERFVEELDRALVRRTKYFCFVELYTIDKFIFISVACGLDMIYVYVDYDSKHGRFKPLVFKVRSLA
jgi:hypothetical protein